MKNILSQSEQELINKFDRELLAALKEDLNQFRAKHQTNLIDFTTRRFDLELLNILKQEIKTIRNATKVTLARVV